MVRVVRSDARGQLVLNANAEKKFTGTKPQEPMDARGWCSIGPCYKSQADIQRSTAPCRSNGRVRVRLWSFV